MKKWTAKPASRKPLGLQGRIRTGNLGPIPRSALSYPPRPLLAIIFAILTGCNGIPKPPTEVLVPVPVQCYDRMPDKPDLAKDADLAKMDDFGFVLRLAKDRLEARGYIAELEGKLEGCVK